MSEIGQRTSSTKFPIDGVVVKPALSKLKRQRSYSMRKAEEMLEAAAPGKRFEYEPKARTLKLDGTTVFSQQPYELDGTFFGEFAQLRLP